MDHVCSRTRCELTRIRYNFTGIRDVHAFFILFQFLLYFNPNSSLNSLISSREIFLRVKMSSILPLFPQMSVILANILHMCVYQIPPYIPAKRPIFCPLFPSKDPNSLPDSSILLNLDTGLQIRSKKHIYFSNFNFLQLYYI